MSEPQLLAHFADDAGYTRSDVAFLSGLEESTVGRLWSEPNWLDRISGRSLQALIPILPGVVDYLATQSLERRRSEIIEQLARRGLEVKTRRVVDIPLSRSTPEPYVGNALEAALHIMNRDVLLAARHLTRFWGKDQDLVLGRLFDQSHHGLLNNTAKLLEAAEHVGRDMRRHDNSFHCFMGYATVVHHIARSAGDVDAEPFSGARQQAFLSRSRTIGMIIKNDDFDMVDTYARVVNGDPVAGMIEDWSFPTYAHDAPVSKDFLLPRSLLLARTAEELCREAREYNDAYLYYLLTVYLPRAVRRDATLGGRRGDINVLVLERRESASEPRLQAALERLSPPLGGQRRSRDGLEAQS